MTTKNRQRIVRTPLQKSKRADLCVQHKSALDPQLYLERMKIMTNHSNAAPHVSKSTNHNISAALKRRARSVINYNSIDASTRAVIRYGLEINDPLLPDLVRSVDAGESIIETVEFSRIPATSEGDSSKHRHKH